MNTIKIKHGSGDPSGKLQPYELGFRDDTGALYINNGTKAVQLTGLAATGLVSADSYLKLPKVTSTTSNTGRILVANSSGVVYYKTPANILSEIGALSNSGGTISGNLTISGKLTANGTIVVDTDSYGYYDPNGVPGDNSKPAKDGIAGQLYFVLVEE